MRAPSILPALALALLLAAPAGAVTYEFAQSGTGTILGTIEIAEPPGSGAGGWSTTDPADVLSLFLDDATFGLGSGNLMALPNLADGGWFQSSVGSSSGSALDSGGLQDQSTNTFGAFGYFELSFNAPAGNDFVESFASSAFVAGDWGLASSVPEPGAAALLAPAVGVALAARRRRP